jgi:4-hydroxybenzoate polyprenyltransferase
VTASWRGVRLLPYLQLLRVGTLFSPAADVVAGLCLAGLPWSADAVRAVGASVCAYAAGMVLNDHADRRQDARQRPERPIPSGAVAAGAAALLGLLLLAAALALAPWLPYYALLVALVVAYDYGLKRSAAAGALTMGLLRGLNLAAGAVAVTQAGPPRALLVAAAAYGVYVVAVTLVGALEDEPNVRRRTAVSIQLVPPWVAALALLGMPRPWPWAAVGLVLALAFSARLRVVRTWTRRDLRVSMTWLLVGTMLYTGLLCATAGRYLEAAAVWAAAAAARWIAKRIALT